MIFNMIKNFYRDCSGLALIEGAMLLPILLTILFGMYDIGHAIILNQKVVSSAHVASDLITRKVAVDAYDISESISAARLVLDPYDTEPWGIDIVSIEFDEDEVPFTIWRETVDMTAIVNLPANAEGLGLEGEGVVAVAVAYDYDPFFSGGVLGAFRMTETAFLRGRRSATVPMKEE